MAVGRRASLILRSRPAANAAVVARSAGSAVVWVEGRTANGRWLWVAYGDGGARAWVATADVQVFGDLATMTVTDATGVAQAAPVSAGPPATTAVPDSGRSSARLPAATRPPAQPQLTGKIAFQTASGGDIYLMDADGTHLRRITDGMDPALSPDGTQLAFARWAAPHGIFAIDLRTGAERRVVSADRPRSPTWQADGSTLAFAQVSRDVTCLDTPLGCYTEAAVRRQFGGQECLQTPAGRFCIGDFPVKQIQETGLAQVSSSGENRLDLPALNDAQSPVWHPQRAEVLYRGGGGLQVTAPNGETRPVLQDPALNSPAWSPDGQRIVVQVHLHDNTDIFLLDAAGNRLARLTAPATTTAPAPRMPRPPGRLMAAISSF